MRLPVTFSSRTREFLLRMNGIRGRPFQLSMSDIYRVVDSAILMYTGEYTVTPRVSTDVTLPTKGTFLKENVTVKQIPQFAVSNTQGGTTLIIGEENSNGN